MFLPDGNPESLQVVSKSHWTGVAASAPRVRYADVRQREEFAKPGVYLLLGPPDDVEFERRIYVGEAEIPRQRLDTHHANKDFWTQFVVFSSQGPQTLNKASIRYLEAKLLQLAAAAGRVELDNGNAPALPPLTEADAADAEAFLEDMLVVYRVLGVTVFDARDEEPAAFAWLKLVGPSASGTGAETDEGFLVKGGALARAETVPSMPGWASAVRKSLIDSGTLLPDSGAATQLRLTMDHMFASPSAAAAVLLGRSAAGPVEWKDDSGKTLKALREATLGPAS